MKPQKKEAEVYHWMPTKEKFAKIPSLTSPYSPSFIPRRSKNSICQEEEKVSVQRTQKIYYTPNTGLQPRPIHAGKSTTSEFGLLHGLEVLISEFRLF